MGWKRDLPWPYGRGDLLSFKTAHPSGQRSHGVADPETMSQSLRFTSPFRTKRVHCVALWLYLGGNRCAACV
jgi:hypothetical protein